MELSRRLQAVASLVGAGNRIADIGTDHAYLPISLIERHQIPSAIAMDIHPGPLKRAEEHVREHGLEKRIELRLSDGMQKLAAFEVDTAVLSGMGGGLMIQILEAYPEVTMSLKECVLQPQSEIAKVRTFLLEEGFFFLDEEMVKEDGKYYPMMKVRPPLQNNGKKQGGNHVSDPDAAGSKSGQEETAGCWNMTELRYGKLLLEKKHPVLQEYLEKERREKKQILSELEGLPGMRIARRKEELEQELSWIEKGLEYDAV